MLLPGRTESSSIHEAWLLGVSAARSQQQKSAAAEGDAGQQQHALVRWAYTSKFSTQKAHLIRLGIVDGPLDKYGA